MTEDIKNSVQKGTTTVGVICKDCVVLGADKRASAGYRIANKKMMKVIKINPHMAVTMAGLVSDAQLITKLIKAELRLKKIRTKRDVNVKEAANLLGNILYTNIRRMSMVPSIVSFLLGGYDKTGPKLYELGIDGSVAFIDDFISTGSGSSMAFGVLETLYKPNMNVNDAVELVKKSINAAIQRDMPTGDGIDIFVVDAKGARRVESQKVEYALK